MKASELHIRFTSITDDYLDVVEVVLGECFARNAGVFGGEFKACYVTFGADGLGPLGCIFKDELTCRVRKRRGYLDKQVNLHPSWKTRCRFQFLGLVSRS